MQSGAWREASASTATPRLFEQVAARLRRDYIDSIPLDEMHRKAAFGLVKELEDGYSSLLTPERAQRLREQTSGRYAGIGVELDVRDEHVSIIAPLAGTPADSAGIRPGDRIIAIDDKPTAGRTVDEVQQSLRGPAGSRIRLTLLRGAGEELDLTITRRQIRFAPVRRAELLPQGIGYIAFATFSEQATTELRAAIDRLRGSGARSLILDLRENPGGLLEEGIQVAEIFLNAGQTIVSTSGRTPDARRVFRASAREAFPGMRIVALVDSGTASAAEIVASALQDNRRAVLVGSPTYGKGSAQSLFPLPEGHVLKLTTALWFTPSGRTIERDSTSGGITPDFVVRDTSAVAPNRPLLSDPVIARAIRILSS